MAAEPQLTPACELAFTVAREGAEAFPALEPPAAMRSFLYVPQLPRRALTVAQRAIDDDPEFRRRVAERATEDGVGRAGWLWLHRPAGWDAELGALTGRSGLTTSWGIPADVPDAARPSPAPSAPLLTASNGERLLLTDIERELDGLRSMVTRLVAEQEVVPSAVEQLTEELEQRQAQVAELAQQLEATLGELENQRAETAEVLRDRDHLATALEAALDERDRVVQERAELVQRLERAAADLADMTAQRLAFQAELEHLLEARDQHSRRHQELLDDLGQHLSSVERERAALAQGLDQARAVLDAVVSHVSAEGQPASFPPAPPQPLAVEQSATEQPAVGGAAPTTQLTPVPQDEPAPADLLTPAADVPVAPGMSELFSLDADAVVEPAPEAPFHADAGFGADAGAVAAPHPDDVAAAGIDGEQAWRPDVDLPFAVEEAGEEVSSLGAFAGWGNEGNDPLAESSALDDLLAPYLGSAESAPTPTPGPDIVDARHAATDLASWLEDAVVGSTGGEAANADDDEWERLVSGSSHDLLSDDTSSAAGGTSVDELDWDTFVEPRREAWTNPGLGVAGARRPVVVPAEIERDAVAAARYLVAVPDVIVIIDGDAVASLGWPTLPVVDRRDALVSYLADLAGDTGAAPDVVFDGECGDEQGLPYSDTVRVRLTAPEVTAARAVAELVDTYPLDWPVVVVTDNPNLVDQARQRGAVLMSNVQLLDLFIAQ